MVKLLLTPLRGNHARTFPYKGHLGLSPVTLAGTVQTEIEEDKTLLQASSVDIRIRCYEAEWSNKCKALNFDKARVIYQVGQRLWSSTGDLATLDEPDLQDHADQQVYKPLGNFKSTWKLSIPVNAIEQGARSTMTFSRWRIWWALEAGETFVCCISFRLTMGEWAVIHHKPQRIHGSQVLRHYHLHLMSHAYPAPSRPITWSNHSPSFSATSSPSPPLIEYTAHLDSDTYSPGQRMTLALDLKRTVADSKLSIKKVVVELRRSITMHPDSPHSSPDRDVSLTPPEPSATPTSEVDIEYFNRPISSQRSFGPPLRTPPPPTASTSLSPAHMPNGLGIPSDLSRTETNSVMTLTSTEAHFDSSGVARIVLTGFIPRRKTEHCWSLGETTRTKHLSVRFFLATQVCCPYLRLLASRLT